MSSKIRTLRWAWIAAGLALVVLLGLAYAESRGWPWLAGPIERSLSDRLGRPLQMHALQGVPLKEPGAESADRADRAERANRADHDFSLHFWGGLRLQAAQLRWAAPAWSSEPHTVLAHGLQLELRYSDLWRAWRGQPLRVKSLQADRFEGTLERLADGRASWQLSGQPTAPSAGQPASAVGAAQTPLPYADVLLLRDGHLLINDALLALHAKATWTLSHGPAAGAPAELKLQATGRYQTSPLKVDLLARSVAADATKPAASGLPLALALQAVVGRARLDFDGLLTDAVAAEGLQGRFKLAGPSLAAVGDPFGVTLPTTGAFQSHGGVHKVGAIWYVVLDEARIGGSKLQGAFSFDRSRAVPRLSGQLSGPRLLLKDLGPAVGVQATAGAAPAQPNGRPGKVLPDRPFDLAALRVMDANVLIDIKEVDLNTSYLEPLRPLRAHLQLVGGVLDIGGLDAQLAAGRLRGSLQLDGRGTLAAVRTDLRWDGLRLERWIHQPRGSADAPPYVSGALQGVARLQGQGASTAQILAQLKGQLRTELRGGRVSHLAIEAAGLDVAQAVGVLIRGDSALTVTCAVADLVADRGVFVPRLMVLDTTDSTLWLDGSVSLASELLDMRVVVSPKDFSPLALRTPLRLHGSLAQPQVSIVGGRLAGRLGLAALLAFVNPLAALLPLLDPGDQASAERYAGACQGLVQRATARNRTAPASKPASK